MIIGASVAAVRTPGPAVTSAIQHFAAGVVFAAAASEILPDLKHAGSVLAIVIGGAAGLATMLTVKSLSSRAKGGVSLIAVTGIDILIDGLVLGIGFAAGARQGILLTIALTMEILFLGVTMSLELREVVASRVRAIAMTAGIGLLLPLGAAIGTLAGGLPEFDLAVLFAFGLIALLYLVTEELLVEAHEMPDSAMITSLFFMGFLLLIVLEEVI
ncbi:MAG: transporter [Alphaproteobacteria bacterium]|nr:transporter [Alphaproteobacteria bacterium]